MGYEDTFRIPVSDTQAYKQFGNSVVTPVRAKPSHDAARAKIVASKVDETYRLTLQTVSWRRQVGATLLSAASIKF
jgi:hypothetical protein